MSLRNILSGVLALARRGKAKPLAVNRGPVPDRYEAAVFVGDASTGNVYEFRADQPAIQRPAQPRPPTPSEMVEGKRP